MSEFERGDKFYKVKHGMLYTTNWKLKKKNIVEVGNPDDGCCENCQDILPYPYLIVLRILFIHKVEWLDSSNIYTMVWYVTWSNPDETYTSWAQGLLSQESTCSRRDHRCKISGGILDPSGNSFFSLINIMVKLLWYDHNYDCTIIMI